MQFSQRSGMFLYQINAFQSAALLRLVCGDADADPDPPEPDAVQKTAENEDPSERTNLNVDQGAETAARRSGRLRQAKNELSRVANGSSIKCLFLIKFMRGKMKSTLFVCVCFFSPVYSKPQLTGVWSRAHGRV